MGIVRDSDDQVRSRLVSAAGPCDIVITSGGVSMGAKDFVKPLLEEIGTVLILNIITFEHFIISV